MKINLKDILKCTDGVLTKKGNLNNFNGISIDSRSIKKGEVFVGIEGTHFNGNDFVLDAVQKGAACLIVGRKMDEKTILGLPDNISVINVANGIYSLGDLASWWRSKFKIPCVAITGSNGKSTTKELVAAIASARGGVLKTEGNFNNNIGLPLTVFRWTDEVKTAVIEMGMNAKGEIRRLATIVKPDIGVITNVTAAHLEKLNSVEGVALAKGELFEVMDGRGVAIINDEDVWVKKLGKKYPGRTITFGMQNSSDIQFRHMESIGFEDTILTLSIQGEERKVKLPLVGIHNVMNAMSAVAVGVALNVKTDNIIENVVKFKPMSMRFERVQLTNGVCLINDSYNANPLSMKAAFRTVGSVKKAGRFVAVLGDMLELGDQSKMLHKEVGHDIVKYGVKVLFTFGTNASEIAKGAVEEGLDSSCVHVLSEIEELEKAVITEIRTGDVLLVKGSRGMRMERVVEYLKHNIGSG